MIAPGVSLGNSKREYVLSPARGDRDFHDTSAVDAILSPALRAHGLNLRRDPRAYARGYFLPPASQAGCVVHFN
jgi:hypothetical protein